MPAVADSYDVVVVGDSLLLRSVNALERSGWLLDIADGRQPYFGFAGSTSSWEAVGTAVPRVKPNGWFVFQDNGLPVSDADWAQLITEIVRLMPDDRCLLLVTTYASRNDQPTPRPYPHPDGLDHTRIALDLVEAQPCHRAIRWDLAVVADPSLVEPDGLHPTRVGSDWLTREILDAVAA